MASTIYVIGQQMIDKFTKKKGATKHCAYGTCKSDSRYPDRPEMDGVFFIRFPQSKKEPEKCLRWANACSRQNFSVENVKKDTYICSLHFVGGKGPTTDHPHPIPATATKFDIQRLQKKPRKNARRRLILSPLTNINDNNESTPQDESSSRLEVAEILLSFQDHDNQVPDKENLPVPDKENLRKRPLENPSSPPVPKRLCVIDQNNVGLDICMASDETREMGTQTLPNVTKDMLSLKIQNHQLQYQLQKTIGNDNDYSRKSDSFSLDDVKDDDKKMQFYTGLTFLQFQCLWRFLGDSVNNLSRPKNPNKDQSATKGRDRKLTPENELFLTLVRLRLGLLHQDIAYRFGISVSTVHDILETWIQFLFVKFSDLRPYMFPSRKKLHKTLPKSFRRFKNVRVILDCTEFFTQAPRNYQQQGNMYSSYKNHCTAKVLIGITPSGAISFVSDVYEGSISDKDIFKKSGILDLVEKGDLVMVDRGFQVRDLLLEKGADIVIPPSLAGRDHLTPQEEALTRNIAKKRIHVERVIERMKKFKILKKTVQLNILPTFSQIVFIVACLVNFQKPIVK